MQGIVFKGKPKDIKLQIHWLVSFYGKNATLKEAIENEIRIGEHSERK